MHDERFTVPRCRACGDRFWHPRRHCPNCLSTDLEFVEPEWPATVYTFTVNHRPRKSDGVDETTTIGYVELADGLRFLVNLELAEPAIGARVRPELRTTADGTRFVFVGAA